MYFVVIMAFALVLSEDLPPERCDVISGLGLSQGGPAAATLLFVVAQMALVAAGAFWAARGVVRQLANTAEGHDRAASRFARSERVLMGLVAVLLVCTIVFTPWAPVVREGWRLGRVPLLGDLVILAPFFISLAIVWGVFFRADLRIREVASALAASEGPVKPREQTEARAALASAKRGGGCATPSLHTYLLDKFRHQILIVAVPMSMIVFAKYFTNLLKPESVHHGLGPSSVPGGASSMSPLLRPFARLPWLADSLLGLVSVCILAFAPVMLRYMWTTEPLPDGAMRDRFVRTCRRIGLRYREILLWHTHGLAINAAVMGFIPPLRYILLSDALLETMDERGIEAVFGHEAGHVRHWHLQFFVLFALLSMYVSGGVFLLLVETGLVTDPSLLQLISLAVLLTCWLFGFGWLSRRFERQADLYGVRCVTPDIQDCVADCPVHGERPASGLCTGAANLFGRTLEQIADMNGIPREAPSWRHGSIADRCRLIERLARDGAALRRFDRSILVIKTGLFLACLGGTVAAGLVYYQPVMRMLGL